MRIAPPAVNHRSVAASFEYYLTKYLNSLCLRSFTHMPDWFRVFCYHYDHLVWLELGVEGRCLQQ